MNQKQGESDEDAPRCPTPRGFVLGRCSLCGAMDEGAEGAAPAVAVGHETLRQGGDGGEDGVGDSDDYAASCPPHPRFVHGLCSRCGAEKEEEDGGVAPPPGVAVGHETMRQGGDRDGDYYAASCPPHPGFVHGVWEAAGGDALPGVAVGYDVTNQGRGDEDDNSDEDEDDDTDTVVEYIHGEGPVLPVPAIEEAMSIVSASDRATLMRERKLILILDLDHTLLNSTSLYDLSPVEQAKGFTPYTFGDTSIDLFRVDIDNLSMLVKLGAFARGFLKQANALFEMHVYTLGIRAYARAAVRLLDPNGIYFGGRIVSRNESTKENTKSLDVIQGADPAMVVILDDTDGVWPGYPDNLILMDRYRYFASTCRTFDYDIPSLAEQGLEEREHDGSLAVVLGALQRIHQGFFDGHRADVREVIAKMWTAAQHRV
uniref:RNA polymerase II C-terminal domain phosphatase-like n=1 Tax=Zea mays TaxID=4577 RepID=A0A804PQE8_MAIZE